MTVFPDQDGEGTLDVVVSLDGPDAFVLDRAVEPFRTLFAVVHGADGPVPAVPLVAELEDLGSQGSAPPLR